jgi:hypothetical protein
MEKHQRDGSRSKSGYFGIVDQHNDSLFGGRPTFGEAWNGLANRKKENARSLSRIDMESIEIKTEIPIKKGLVRESPRKTEFATKESRKEHMTTKSSKPWNNSNESYGIPLKYKNKSLFTGHPGSSSHRGSHSSLLKRTPKKNDTLQSQRTKEASTPTSVLLNMYNQPKFSGKGIVHYILSVKTKKK